MTDCRLRALTFGLLASTATGIAGVGAKRPPQRDQPQTTGQSPAPGTNATDVTRAAQARPAVRRRRQGIPDQTEIIITATKREENLQNVPISVQVLGTRRLDQLNISNFEEYTKQLPSVSFQTAAAGLHHGLHARRRNRRRRAITRARCHGRHLSRRAAGHDHRRYARRPHLRHRPDREPSRSARHALRRSSEAGTIRIITNKPELGVTTGRIDGEINTVDHGGVGGKLEGMINLPIAPLGSPSGPSASTNVTPAISTMSSASAT